MATILRDIYAQEGVRGWYRVSRAECTSTPPPFLQGYIPGLFGTSHGAVQIMTYDLLKRQYTAYAGDTSLESDKQLVSMMLLVLVACIVQPASVYL
jgi:hypothetical protein